MYIDINVSFAAGTNEYAYVEDAQDIIKSLERLFSTRIGSVPFNRTYGSSLYNLLFENNNIETYQIAMLIYQEIQTFEPRIRLSPADVVIKELDEHTYEIEAKFIIPNLDNTVGQVTTTIAE